MCLAQWYSGPSSTDEAKITPTRLRCSLVDAIATKLLLSWWWTSRSLRNINFSKGNVFFYLYVYFFFTLSQTKTTFSQLTIWVTQRLSYKKPELSIFRQHIGSHTRTRGEVSIPHLFLVFYVVVFRFVCLCSVSCAQCCLYFGFSNI